MTEKTYRIGEAAAKLNLKTYVLRFWEMEFPQITPIRTEKGQRLYREADLAILGRIRYLLHERGLTIEGARRLLREEAARGVTYASPGAESAALPDDIPLEDFSPEDFSSEDDSLEDDSFEDDSGGEIAMENSGFENMARDALEEEDGEPFAEMHARAPSRGPVQADLFSSGKEEASSATNDIEAVAAELLAIRRLLTF